MVNSKRLESKLPGLLTDGPTTRKRNYNSRMRNRYRLSALKKNDPKLYNFLINRTVVLFVEWEKALKQK
ncbi:MAG: hypothetical protein IAX22_02565 [Candidatus Bathyarchaeota archaeon]|nr:hypothetical protein [Candidatus Bathyarchaeota archaeon]